MIEVAPGQKAPLLVEEEEEENVVYDNAAAVHETGIDFEAGEIWLFGDMEYSYGTAEWSEEYPDPGVTYIMAQKFAKNLRLLSNDLPDDETILIHQSTPGGCWVQGMVAYQALRMCPQNTVVLNYAESRSMSSLIPQAANRFYMMPKDSRYMYHTGTMGGLFTGTQMDTEYREWKVSQKRMEDIYIDAIKRRKGTWHKRTRPQIRKLLRAQMKEHEEVYLTPEEAVAHGFADGIFDGDWDALVEF